MSDYEYLFAINLQAKLKEKIKGKIFCGVRDDVLTIRILKEDFEFVQTIPEFAGLLILGRLDKDEIVKIVCKQYKNALMAKYFREY